MDDSSPGVGVDFVIDTSGAFAELLRFAQFYDDKTRDFVRQAATFEKASEGMLQLSGARSRMAAFATSAKADMQVAAAAVNDVTRATDRLADIATKTAGIEIIGPAATREADNSTRAIARTEQQIGRMVFAIERETAATGRSKDEQRQLRIEELALTAARQGNTDAADRLHAATRRLIQAQQAAAEDRFAASLRAEAEAAQAEAAALARANGELMERARLQAALDRTAGTDRPSAIDAGATYSALASRAIEEEAQALRNAAGAYAQFELAARRGMAALREQEAVQAAATRETEELAAAAIRLRASVDPVFAAQQRFNTEMAQARTLVAGNAISLDDYCAKLRMEQAALDESTAAHRRGAAGSAAARQAMQGASYQVQDFITQVSMGTNPINAFAVQGAQLAGQFSSVEGKAGDVARFFIGPWGLAITAGTLILAPFVAKLWEQGKALDDAVDKLKKDAVQTEATARAKEAFAHTAEGVAAAIRDGTEATNKAIAAERTSAEQANITAKNNLVEELSIRGKTQARLADAKAAVEAQIQAARATGERGDVAGQGILKLIQQAAALQRELDKQTGDIATAQARVQQTRIELAAEAAQRAVDPLARINKLYDDQITAAQRRARAEGSVTTELTRQLTAIERNRQAAIKAEQDKAFANRNSVTANRQTGRTVGLSEAEGIVRSIGGIITSTTRSFEQQRVLYEKYLAGRGPLAAKPGTSDHEVGNAIDIAKTPGMSLAKIREAFAAQGVAVKQLLDEGRHFHVAWKKGADDAAAASRKLADAQVDLTKKFDPAAAAALEYRQALSSIAAAKLSPDAAKSYAEAAQQAFLKARAAAFKLPSIDEIAEQVAATDAADKAAKEFATTVLQPLKDQVKLYGLVGAARDQAALALEKEAFLARNMDQGLDVALARWQEYYDLKSKVIGKDAAAEQAEADARRLADNLDGIVDAADRAGDAMARAFGRAGGAIGDAVSLLADYGRQQKQIDDQAASGRLKPEAARQKAAELQLSTTIGLIGATKTLFNERSKGYRVMEAAEKALTIVQLARTAVDVAGGAARMFASLGPWAFPAVGAMLAVMAGLGFSGGGGGSTAVPTAKDMQDAQGTGSVLGSSDAKSESIARSLDILSRNSNRDLEYGSAMVRSLRSIETGIGSLAALIAREMGMSGGAFSQEGLGIGKSTSLPGALDFTGIGLAAKLPVIGGFVTGILKTLFGTKTTVELLDQGITFAAQSVEDIINGGFAGQVYQDVATTKKKKFLGITTSNKTSVSTSTSDLDDGMEQQIALLIESLRGGVLGAAATLGIEGAQATLDAFQINLGKISLKGLTGEEIEKELQGVFGKLGDQMAGAAVGGLAEFQKVGEGLFETLVRLSKEYAVVDTTLRSIGMTFGAVGAASVGARSALIDLFGGMDEFTEQTGFFRENFLSEAEQMAPVIAAVRAEMDRLGLAGVTSKDAFKSVVLGLDLSSASGQEMYAALMAVAPAFAKSTEYLASLTGELKETAKTAEQLAAIEKQRRSLQIQLMEATGDTAGALAAKRADELAGLDESLRALQQQVYAATDAAQAARDLAAANEEAARAATAAAEETKRAAAALAEQRRGLEIDLMEATGNAVGALAARRADELAALDASLRPIKEAIFAAQDAAAAQEVLAAAQATAAQTAQEQTAAALALAQTRRSMEIDLMEATGNAVGALAARRADELAALDPSLRALREQIWAAQDAAAANAALADAQRQAAQAAEQLAQQRATLGVSLLRAQGMDAEAIAAERALQLAATDESLRGLQSQVWAAEDARAAAEAAAREQEQYAAEQKAAAAAAEQLRRQRAGMEATLQDLLGNAAAATAIRRREELKALDASLRPLQQAIWAQEDLAEAAKVAADKVNDARGVLTEAYKRESDALQQTIDTMGGLGESLRKYRAELGSGGDATVDAYRAAQALFNVTDAKAARGDAGALAALEAAGKDFLAASRDNAGSLLDYQRDVAKVAGALDRGIGATDEAVDYAQAQLDALKASVTGLIDIDESVVSVRDAIVALSAEIARQKVPVVPSAPVTATSGQQQTPQISTAELERKIQVLIDRTESQNASLAENSGKQTRMFEEWNVFGLPTRSADDLETA